MNEFIEIPASEKSLSNRRLVFGKGSNDATYMTQTTFNGRSSICPYYSRWRDLLKRCYSDKFQNKNTSYIGCSIASEWIKFSNFKSWMEKQDWEGKELDKDLLVQGNKVYGPSTCIFVPREINLIVKNSVKKIASYLLAFLIMLKVKITELTLALTGDTKVWVSFHL